MLVLCLPVCALVAQQKPPVFRAKIDLMQLDVTVLDKNGKPVRGLTKDDFTLLEDNKLQTIEGFSAVDVPDRVVGGPVWEDKVAADVTTNEIDNARIFVLLIDDGFGMGAGAEIKSGKQTVDLWAIKAMRANASDFIQSLGPKDLAGVVFTGTASRFSQNLTNDRRKLLDAIAAYPDNDGTLFFKKAAAPTTPDARHQCYAAKEVLRMTEAAVLQLASLPDRRKAILYFGGSLPWAEYPTSDVCGTYWLWREVFAAAQQGSVTINPIQIAGLGGPIDRYLSVADYTGGHAVINTNDFKPGLARIRQENSSYYLIAYQPTRDIADGTFRRITVKVKNRPDVEVVTRRNYWAPRQRPSDEPHPPAPSEAVKAMSGLLPDSRLALRVSAIPFAGAGDTAGTIAISLGIRQPAFANRTSESVELMIRSFTTTGDPKAGDDQLIPITVPAARADADVTRYEVLARIDVAKPGPYHLRLSARSDASDVRGSVYVDVDVPDYQKAKLSMSGVVVNHATASTPTAPLRLLRDITPLNPTSERTFASNDIVTTLVRIYQGGNDRLIDVPMRIAIQDAAGKAAFSSADVIAANRFVNRSADFQFRLPLDKLEAGEYLLTFDAAAAKNTARRDVRFQKSK